MNAVFLPILTFIISLYVALLWLKPEKSNALRCAMIVLPSGFLLYLMGSAQLSGEIGHHLQSHILRSSPLLVFLLGFYALKVSRMQAIQAIGVWYAVSCLIEGISITLQWQDTFPTPLALQPLGTLLGLGYMWLFILGCAGKGKISAGAALLIGGAIYAIDAYLDYYMTYGVNYLRHFCLPTACIAPGVHAIHILSLMLYIACFTAVMHCVCRVTLRRSLLFGLLCAIPSIILPLWLLSTL